MAEKKQKLNLKRIVGYYWQYVCKHPWLFVLVLVLYTIGIALVEIVTPLIMRDVIDTMSGSASDVSVAQHLWLLFWTYLAVVAVQEISFRGADFAMVRLEARVVWLLTHAAFDRLALHSARFFGERFSGALIAQSRRFVNNFQPLLDGFVYHI